MKKSKKILFVLLTFILLLAIVFFGLLIYFFSPVSKKYDEHNIIIPSGSTITDISNTLKKEKLIKNEMVFKIYLKLKKVDNIYAAAYYISPNMNLKEIVEELQSGGHNESEITVTFNEGLNMRQIAKIIDENTNNSYDDVMNLLKDKNYLDSLIKKYWFLTDDIKNNKIYYSLEGYLFPDTYRFSSEDATVEEIFEVMLDEMEEKLNNYKKTIEKSNYSIHQLLTIASITQSEGVNSADFKNIASVFYNRLKTGMALGSCVTSYYGVKKEMTEELFMADINASNAYNTRGKNPVSLPVGPISNPGLSAIDSVLNPIETDYYYFVSDKNRKLYFTKSNSEHEAMIDKLMDEGLWYEW